MFICLCETFLSDDITDPEVYLPGYSISRCDRANRIGGGVCIYVKDSISLETCVSFSNSTCELLILKLVEPELIIILLYRPPSCTIPQLEDMITIIYSYLNNLGSPLPNIVFLGDFNLPNMNWQNPNPNTDVYRTLCPLLDFYFLEQLVTEPTRKQNILDLIFSNPALVDSICITETYLSDHCLLLANTCIPVCKRATQNSHNPSTSIFENLNFNKCDFITVLLLY